MSTTDIVNKSEELFGIRIGTATIYKALIRYGIPVRSKSESVSLATRTLNYDESYLNEDMIEWIDGFLLGDGSVRFSNVDFRVRKRVNYARFSMASVQKQWVQYAFSKFTVYSPRIISTHIFKNDPKNPNPLYMSKTLGHPDIARQAERWYPLPKCNKIIPQDIRITPTSVLLWYLGDGSLVYNKNLKLATCGFSDEDINTILIPKLENLGIHCYLGHWKQYAYIWIRRDSMGKFFDFIGHESPISCYAYKFNCEKWYTYKRLSDIIRNNRERWRARYYFKIGKLDCFRSPGDKLLLFNEDQANKLRDILDGKIKIEKVNHPIEIIEGTNNASNFDHSNYISDFDNSNK